MKEYRNNIFPRCLCITGSIEEANELFVYPNRVDGKFVQYEGVIATTYCANYKSHDDGCLLLVINKPLTVGTICHEALHITRTIIEELPCPLTDDTEEVWCYTIGWVASCISDFVQSEQNA